MTEKGLRQFLWREVSLHLLVARIAHGPVLSRCVFIERTIIGPAVVVVMDCVFEGCTTRDPVDRIWWPAPSLPDAPAVHRRSGAAALHFPRLRLRRHRVRRGRGPSDPDAG